MKAKSLAIVTALFASASLLAGCGPTKSSSQSSSTPSSSASSEESSTSSKVTKRDKKDFAFLSGLEGVTDPVAKQTASAIDNVMEGKGTKKAGAKYTYRTAVNSLPTAWNTHTYQSNDATYITDYTEDSLYTFDYNETKDGFRIVLGMAAASPVDVTESFVGKYGVTTGEKGKVYKITLRSDLKFDNGGAIEAEDFVESLKLLLNPEAGNYRADSVYTGNFSIVGAEDYAKGGKYGLSEFVSEAYGDDEYVDPSTFTEAEGGVLQTKGCDVVLDLTSGGNWGSNSLLDYDGAGYLLLAEDDWAVDENEWLWVINENGTLVLRTDGEGNWKDVAGNPVTRDANKKFFDKDGNEMTNCTGIGQVSNALFPLCQAADEDGHVKLTKTTLKALQDCIAILHGYETADEYADDAGDYAYQEFEEMAFLGKVFDKVEWDNNVGCWFDPEHPLDLYYAIKKPLFGFYLYYSLASSMWLTDTAKYKSCISNAQGVYTCSYGTSVSTYTGFGPYKLTEFVDGNKAVFAKNEYWYGYNDSENANLYWTTDITMTQVASASDRLNMFLRGQLDGYGLQAEDMSDYQSSRYTYYTDGDSTWFVALNPDESGLAKAEGNATPLTAGNEVDKETLSLLSFRQGLSFSLDRIEYELTLDPTGSVAKALYGNMIISDPDNGVAYRTTVEAKDTILKFWDLYEEVVECGFEDGLYETRDEAIATITGYNPTAAKAFFEKAYEEAVLSGFIDAESIESGKWEVQIMIGQPGSGSSTYYNNGYTYLAAAWTNAVRGTSFEGHLTFRQSPPLGSSNFSNFLKKCEIDLLFGVGWTGSTLDPYNLMEAYVAPSYQYDPGWDTSATMLDVKLDDGTRTYTLRASVLDWGQTFLGGKVITAMIVDEQGNLTGDYVEISGGTECKASIRLAVLAAVEQAVLMQYDMIPVGTEASASMRGMKIVYGTEEYVFGCGRGGIKYMTYAYTDAEWSEFVSQQGGTLNYKVSG